MRFNKEKLLYENLKTKDIILMLKVGIGFLYTHNKNYTNSQWSIIMDLYDIINAIEG